MKSGLSPESLFDADGATGEGPADPGKSAGTEVFGGLAEEAGLVVESGRHAGERVALSAGTCVIGRSSKCALVLRRSAGVSRRHSKIRYVGGTYEVSDCGSRNGTRVNGHKIGGAVTLNDGDVIQISDERIRFRGPSGRKDEVGERGLLSEREPDESRLPSRERPGEVQRTQRVRVDSPDSLLLTKDGGTAPRPIPPRPTSSRNNPAIPSQQGVMPAAPTALFTSQLQALSVPQPPPLVMPPMTTVPVRAIREPPKSALFVLGILLGVAVLVGGVTTWDLALNEGRVTSALEEDARLLWSGVDAALRDPGAAPEPPVSDEEQVVAKPPVADEPAVVATPSVTDPPGLAVDPSGAATTESVDDQKVADEESVVEQPAQPEQPLPQEQDAVDAPMAVATKEPLAEGKAESASQAVSLGGLVEVKSEVAGRVRSIAVSTGDVVRQGDVLLVIERGSARNSRKLKALEREQTEFERHAALGNSRAQRDLEAVRREIARLEKRAGTATVKAGVGGRVDGLLVDVGGRIKSGAVLVRIAAGGG